MSLEAALNQFRAEFLEKFPAEKAAIMQRSTDALVAQFTEQRSFGAWQRQSLEIGDLAPDFALPNAVGEIVRFHREC